MKIKTSWIFSLVFTTALTTTFLPQAEENSFPKDEKALTAMQKTAIADLSSIKHVFETKYGPIFWKKDYLNWNLEKEIRKAKMAIRRKDNPTVKDCQIVIRDFFNSSSDYHVRCHFHSTEMAYLPFMVKGSSGRYFVTFFDTGFPCLPEDILDVGDEIIAFNGIPIDQVINDLRVREFGTSNTETDQALAELALTFRSGQSGQTVPSGELTISVRKKYSSAITTKKLNWSYVPEKIEDFSKFNLLCKTPKVTAKNWVTQFKEAAKESGFFNKKMVTPHYTYDAVRPLSQKNGFEIGGKYSFIPIMGNIVWQTPPESAFNAYVFQSPKGKTVGYIRIPTYLAGEQEAFEFARIISFFQQFTDSLIIDQLNNPGGSMFYMYGLASMLTDRPLYAPKHHIALTQEEVMNAINMLPAFENILSDQDARNFMGQTIDGYAVDLQFVNLVKDYAAFMISEWNKGNVLTNPTHIFGVDSVQPNPQVRYTKPILVLINELDFSCGDFFPAILQDNKRALIMGAGTSGAGGFVLEDSFPSHTGLAGFSFTGSLAVRIDNSKIEDLGVKPDIPYQISVNDLKNNFSEFVQNILNVVDQL